MVKAHGLQDERVESLRATAANGAAMAAFLRLHRRFLNGIFRNH
jgi:hypothetical protein